MEYVKECNIDGWTIDSKTEAGGIRYSVDVENKVVIGYLDNAADIIEDMVECAAPRYYHSIHTMLECSGAFDDIPDRIKAIARCHPDDEFDIKTGQRIVKARICAKKRKIACRVIDNINKTMHKLYIDPLTQYKAKLMNTEDVKDSVAAIVNAM